jgi:acid stress-induced BolA-like protein IbaG/YrbA
MIKHTILEMLNMKNIHMVYGHNCEFEIVILANLF